MRMSAWCKHSVGREAGLVVGALATHLLADLKPHLGLFKSIIYSSDL